MKTFLRGLIALLIVAGLSYLCGYLMNEILPINNSDPFIFFPLGLVYLMVLCCILAIIYNVGRLIDDLL